MPSQMASDIPDFQPVARWDTVEGVLTALDVSDEPRDVQRAAIRKARALPGLRELLEPLYPELDRLGLLGG